MSGTAEEPNPRAEALQAELDAVKRREASFRVKMVHEFLDRGERNTYLHTLREERAALIKRGQEASRDLEVLTRKLEEHTRGLEAEVRRAAELRSELGRIKASLSWRLAAPLRAIGRMFSPEPPAAAPAAPAGDASPDGAAFTYYLHTSPFRIYREPAFTLKGWAWPEDGRAVTGVRARVDGRLFDGRTGLEEPEVISRYGPQPSNPHPGFEVTLETPAGRHVLSLEAQLAGSEWRTIMRTTIWCEPDPP
jgi:hypothetical protein